MHSFTTHPPSPLPLLALQFLIEIGIELEQRGDAHLIDVLLTKQGFRKLKTPPFTPGDVVYLSSALYATFIASHPKEAAIEVRACVRACVRARRDSSPTLMSCSHRLSLLRPPSSPLSQALPSYITNQME